jgi:hypothetical protein
MPNETLGYSLGVVEGYLELLVKDGMAGAQTVLDHFHAAEKALTTTNQKADNAEQKLAQLQDILRSNT